MVISEHALEILEFPKILADLAEFCHYPDNRRFALQIRPLGEREKANFAQRLTGDALSLINKWGEAPLYGLSNLEPYLKRVSLDAALSCAELLQVAVFLRALHRLQDYIQPALAEDLSLNPLIPQFADYFRDAKNVLQCAEFLNLPSTLNALTLLLATLPQMPILLKELDRCILDEDNLQDNASKELANLRQKIQEQQNKVRLTLEKIIKSNNIALQDNVITQRNNRFVVPVKASYKQQVPGLVHDSSASEQTLFIEPMAVVELNNTIRELQLAEAKEVQRILLNLSLQVKSLIPELKLSLNMIKLLDFSFAKGKLAKTMQAETINFLPQADLHLLKARHPLLDKTKVVPLDLTLSADIRQLLITGPNTGGKTVCLKTIALLQVMAQSGLAVPVNSGSTFPFYQHIFVDIGDEQSVKLNLSTFSAHMRNIITILHKADSDSLVLLDELGSGTDPSEGAALARAILESFLQKQAMTFASTHYRELKIYALNTEHVLNAACEFDSQTMQPTYRLLLGAAGVSNAFTIAHNLGLAPEIINSAKKYLSTADVNFAEALSNVEKENGQVKKLQAELHDKLRDAEIYKLQAQREKEKIQTEREKLKSTLLQENQREYKQKLAEVDSLLAELKDFAVKYKSQNKNVSSLPDNLELGTLLRKEVKTELHNLQGEIHQQTINELFSASDTNKVINNAADIVLNAYYKAPKLHLQGQAVSVDFSKQEVVLKNKNLQIKVPVVGLILLSNSDYADEDSSADKDLKSKYAIKAKNKEKSYHKLISQTARSLPSELNIIGQRYNDAEILLSQYIDQAVLSGVDSVRIVHGKGSGILRKMVENFARNDKRIKACRLGEFGEGDTGVSILTLK